MVDLFSVYWGTSILFSILTLLIYIPINSVLALPFLHILIRICYCLFYNSHFNWEIILHCGFDISIMISDVEHVFICLLAICMSFFFWARSIQITCPFLNWVIWFFVIELRSLYILVIKTLMDGQFANIFAYSAGCLFTLLIASFARSFLTWWNSICPFLLWLPVLLRYYTMSYHSNERPTAFPQFCLVV